MAGGSIVEYNSLKRTETFEFFALLRAFKEKIKNG
jgi:hypothetical protein